MESRFLSKLLKEQREQRIRNSLPAARDRIINLMSDIDRRADIPLLSLVALTEVFGAALATLREKDPDAHDEIFADIQEVLVICGYAIERLELVE